jgi:hypothetical protein
MKKTILAALVVICILAAGCATVGRQFELAQLSQLQPGVSTVGDAVKLFGPPMSESTLPNDTTLLQWRYTHVTPAGITSVHAAVLFDSTGTMIRVTHKYNIKT